MINCALNYSDYDRGAVIASLHNYRDDVYL